MKVSPGPILVSGANGFVGRHVVQGLSRVFPHDEIVQLDRHPTSLNPGMLYCEYNIGDSDDSSLTDLLRRHDVRAVVNCAGTTQSISSLLARQNIGVAKRLVASAATVRPGMPFCQIGSAAEYEMLPHPQQTSEVCPARPQGAYGKSKLASTDHLLQATRDGRVSGYVLRLFNPLGIGMSPSLLMGKVLEYLQSGIVEDLQLGNLGSFRDYVDIRDVAAVVATSMQQSHKLRGEVINIGTGKATSTRTLVEQVLVRGGRGFVENEDAGSARSKWASWQEADISKAKQLLGWEPKYTFRDTVAELAVLARREAETLPSRE
jgi:NDP-hexose 4-ketoreductase